MIDLLLLAAAAKAAAGYEPPPELWYHQAVSCAASLRLTAGKSPSPAQFADLMTWGMIMAETGRKIGRTREQVDTGDPASAEAFQRHLRDRKPRAFAAQRAYCRAVLDADRP